ncbi:MAG: N-acetyl-gamma-glutamyl-phosphate reductase, partial [Bacteroidetes bacterium]|nr:N-acetyl-gamma-glutamyl-phosphate reductase [Bacteroidota bacterium]
MNKVRCSIAGGSGYTAGELLRILLYHPDVEVITIHSHSCTGQPVTSVHRDLLGETELCFSNKLLPTDLLFLCLGHGLSANFLDQQKISPETKVIDLGNDFRLNPVCGNRTFEYGLPEAFGKQIRAASNVANPGCFATAIQLALLPLAQQGLLQDEVHIHAVTGSTGAGRGLSDSTQFSYRSNNLSIYKPFIHQHLGEIRQTLSLLQPERQPLPPLHFIPVRGSYTRGIFATLYTRCTRPIEAVQSLYQDYYQPHPFVHIAHDEISLKEVINTNKC